MTQSIENSGRAIAREQTTPQDFLAKCDGQRDYFSELFRFLDDSEIEYGMGTVGFSIKNAKKQSKMWIYPPTTQRNVEILMRGLHDKKREQIAGILRDAEELDQVRIGKTRITVKPEHLRIEQLKELVKVAAS